MPTHVYQRGETIISIARQYKFRAWRPMWDHGNNSSLRNQRPTPNQLVQGDKIFVPDKQTREHGCITNKRHICRPRGMTQYLQQRLLDEDGDAMPGLAYTLVCAGKTFSGTTDGDGELLEEVSLDAKDATLTVTMPDGKKVE
jgi:N-acetylmuramoyl-L-alanine amidase